MIYYLTLIFVALVANIYSIILSFNIKDKILKIITLLLLCLCLFRYFLLYLFSLAESPEYLYDLRFLILTSIAAIPVVSYICIKLLSKGTLTLLDRIFTIILAAIFMYIVYISPEGIVSTTNGYTVLYSQGVPFIMTLAQCGFAALMIYLSFNYLIKERLIKIKFVYFLYLISFIVVIAESLLTVFQKQLFPESIISDVFVFITIITSMKVKVKDI